MGNLARNFLKENDENKKLFVEGIILKDLKALNKLENDFNNYLYKAYLCSYVKKAIHFSSLKYKQKKDRMKNKEKLSLNVLDENFQEERINVVPDKERDIINEIYENKENFDYIQAFSNEKLSKAIEKLTHKEKKIIKECIINDKSQVEVAKELGISRQAINKVKISALRKLNKELKRV